MVLIHLGAAVYGQTIWSSTTLTLLPGLTVTLTQILAGLSLASLANAILSNGAIALLGARTPLDRLGVKIPRRSGNGLKPVIPAALLSLLAVMAYKLGYYHLNPIMFVLLFGFTYAKLTMKLVVSAREHLKHQI